MTTRATAAALQWLGDDIQNGIRVAMQVVRHGRNMISSLYRITELLSRIKCGNRGMFYYTRSMNFSVVDHFFRKKKTPDFFQTKLIWVGTGLGLGLGLLLGLGLCPR